MPKVTRYGLPIVCLAVFAVAVLVLSSQRRGGEGTAVIPPSGAETAILEQAVEAREPVPGDVEPSDRQPTNRQLAGAEAQASENPADADRVQPESLSAEEQLLDFRMMNPELALGEATETGLEFVTHRSTVDWQAARLHERLPDDSLTREQSELAGASRVPVLLPSDARLLAGGQLTVGGDWYAASMTQDDIHVLINGSARIATRPGDTPDLTRRGTLADAASGVSRSLGMVEASFNAFGVHYSVTVECRFHETEPACLEDRYITDIIDNLLLAEGEDDDEGA